MAKYPSTQSSKANRFLASHHGNISSLQANSWSHCATRSVNTADGLSVWLACLCGIQFETQLLVERPLGCVEDVFVCDA